MDDKDSTVIRSTVINKAISYIFDHIEEDITVDDVAKHCCYSRYHLTRMFKENTDEALYQFIKRVRLERSAWRLKVEKEKSITEIGVDYGYSSSNWYIRRCSAGGFPKQAISLMKDRYSIYTEMYGRTDTWRSISVFR